MADLAEILTVMIQNDQKITFEEDHMDLKEGIEVDKNLTISSLPPFMDTTGVIKMSIIQELQRENIELTKDI